MAAIEQFLCVMQEGGISGNPTWIYGIHCRSSWLNCGLGKIRGVASIDGGQACLRINRLGDK